MSNLRIIEPANGSVGSISNNYLFLEFETDEFPFVDYAYKVYLDGVDTPILWDSSPWKRRKFAKIYGNLSVGKHTIKLVKISKFYTEVSETTFQLTKDFWFLREISMNLSGYLKRTNPAHELGWTWGVGLYLEGCVRLERLTHYDSTYCSEYVKKFHESWRARGIPYINKSDSCTPSLSAMSFRDNGDDSANAANEKVISYLKNSPRNSIGALNHLGNSYSNLFYPRSIWADSLMMYCVPAVRSKNSDLVEFGLDQVEIFSEKLQDPTTGLWRHAWLERFDHVVPETETYWLRGNGWALAAIAEMLDVVPQDSRRRQKFTDIFLKTLNSLILLQQSNGLWDSIANIPGYTYPETAGSLLVAYAIARGVRMGWLDRSYLPVAARVTNAISSRITYDTKNSPFPVVLHDVSGPTNPAPRWIYSLIEEEKNSLYGAGIYFMLCAEMLELERGK